jgi:hypothetical protein
MPDLENLEKQAKLILRRHPEARRRSPSNPWAHTWFRKAPDAELLAASFKHRRWAENGRETADCNCIKRSSTARPPTHS